MNQNLRGWKNVGNDEEEDKGLLKIHTTMSGANDTFKVIHTYIVKCSRTLKQNSVSQRKLEGDK